MKTMKLKVTEMCIRSDLNMLYLTSKSIVQFLEMAETMPLARKALMSSAELLCSLAAEVYCRIQQDYIDDAEINFGDMITDIGQADDASTKLNVS